MPRHGRDAGTPTFRKEVMQGLLVAPMRTGRRRYLVLQLNEAPQKHFLPSHPPQSLYTETHIPTSVPIQHCQPSSPSLLTTQRLTYPRPHPTLPTLIIPLPLLTPRLPIPPLTPKHLTPINKHHLILILARPNNNKTPIIQQILNSKSVVRRDSNVAVMTSRGTQGRDVDGDGVGVVAYGV